MPQLKQATHALLIVTLPEGPNYQCEKNNLRPRANPCKEPISCAKKIYSSVLLNAEGTQNFSDLLFPTAIG
jgi:hypothetical protein